MSHFYGSMAGMAKNHATARGSKANGLEVRLMSLGTERSKPANMCVKLEYDEQTKTNRYIIYMNGKIVIAGEFATPSEISKHFVSTELIMNS